ncbi:hypothetical protein C6499_02600 [Candidatus Poribacteria bacterium]|nr:MAG: hypothetical protein C6499_02600 [Candidatus Poribacteria bacterium]
MPLRYSRTNAMLDVQNLCKSFKKKPFLTELTFQVAAGECLVLLGRNGAGKTLLLNILATLVEPTSGTVSIDGVDAFANLKQVRPSIGYIPVAFEGYPELSVVDYLNFFAAAYKLEKRGRTDAIDAVLELMDIQHLREVKIGVLSTGERQRLLFAKTFLYEPQLWLLDEPLTPLDPSGQVEMIALFSELQAMGKTVVIATNRLDDVHRLGSTDAHDKNYVGILSDGQFSVFKTFRELREENTEADAAETPSPEGLSKLLAKDPHSD